MHSESQDNVDVAPIAPNDVLLSFRQARKAAEALGSALYAALCDSCERDEDILEIASHSRIDSIPAFHLLCAVHYLLMKDPSASAARFYPSLAPVPLSADRAYQPFREFCICNRSELISLLQTRMVQSTSPRRAAYLAPMLGRVADAIGQPLNLVEIGASAGVLMYPDRYRYEYGGRATMGDLDSPVVVRCELTGTDIRMAGRVPAIASRTGVDLQPIDVTIAENRLWLAALLFPEWTEDLRNLSAALDIVARAKPEIVKGDALTVVPGLLENIPPPVCVFHSACLFYWPQAAKLALDERLREASRGRIVHRIGIEPPEDYAQRERQSGKPAERIYSDVTHTVYANCDAQSKVVARCGRFGEWLEWLD